MKKIYAVLLTAILTFSLSACSKDEEVTQPSQIGSDINGYITTDTEWALQTEEKDNIISFSSLQPDDSYVYVTFQTIDMKDSDRELYTLEYITEAYKGFYEEYELENIESFSDMKVGIYPAYSISAEYMNDDTLTDIMTETMIFFDENHNLHIITIEGNPDGVDTRTAYTESYKFSPENLPTTIVRQPQITEDDYDGDYSPYED